MSYKLRKNVNEYSVLWMVQQALEVAPTLSMFTSSARGSIAGMVQRALTINHPADSAEGVFGLNPQLEEVSNASYLIRQQFLDNAALTMLSEKALNGLVYLAVDALYEKVDDE